MSEKVRTEVVFSGEVQGVGFRFTASRIARRFDVTGFVRNLRDGRVELVAEGTPAELEAFIGAIASDMGRNIRDIQRVQRPATGKFAGFGIAHSL